jgi:ABC-2 type transport system permease protein
LSLTRNRWWLVARREWDQRVRSRAFLISTAISVAIVVAIVLVPDLLGAGKAPTRTVGLVGQTSAELPSLLQASGRQLGFTVKTTTFPSQAAGRAALQAGDVSVLLVDEKQLVWKTESDLQLRGIIASSLAYLHTQRAITDLGLTPQQAQSLSPPGLASSSLEPMTKELAARQVLATITVIVLFMAIAFYGGFVLSGIVEEKSSRVVEVLLSRLRPAELLLGKILGIGLVGLAQFALLSAAALMALASMGNSLAPGTSPGTIAWAVIWFILGYSFYSVLYATVGSTVSRQEDTQAVQVPVTVVLVVGYIFSLQTAASPDTTLAVFASLFPPTAPMVMTVRMANGGVPWWQVALAIALLVASVYGLVRLAARIYTGAALRIGPRVRLRDAWRAQAGDRADAPAPSV